MHTHIGLLGGAANVHGTMGENSMLLIARAIVADGRVIRRFPGRGIQQVRDAQPGELAAAFDAALERMRETHKAQDLLEVVDVSTLQRAMNGTRPAVVLAAEGADFLEGDLKRLESARNRGLTHVQLVHYRLSEVGDISTERPKHNGLSAFGKEVVAQCNRLGILVDVAHATSDGIAQALEISVKPIIYSHGHVTSSAPYWTYGLVRARAIHAPLARRIAEKGGVVGIWPLSTQYGSLDAYAHALYATAQALGPEHVGIGSDMFGLGGLTVLPGYESFPPLAELLTKRGLSADAVRGIMGGNYLRALAQALAL